MSALALRLAAQRLGAPVHQLLYWRKTGLLSPGPGGLDFQDLVRIRFIAACRERGLSLQRIRRAIRSLKIQDQSPASADWSSNLELVGLDLLHREADRLVQLETGQMFLPYQRSQLLVFPGSQQLAENAELKELEGEYLREMESGDFQRIRRALERLLRIRPDHLAALIEFGNLCFEFRRYADALRYYDAALELEPNCVEAIYNSANIHFREKRFAAAIRCFQRCLTLDPEFPEAYYNLGLLYYNLRYLEYSTECLQSYLRLDPDSDWSDLARGYIAEMESLSSLGGEADLFSSSGGGAD
ncbi:MAG: tetratricopeptide repeat protein [Leptospirales bacterium]|nr:tetratricopeptide repeat protein [Leptospirales bacterium]